MTEVTGTLTKEELERFAPAIRAKNARMYHVMDEVRREGGHVWIRTATGPNWPQAEHIFWCPQCGEHRQQTGFFGHEFDLDGKCLLAGITVT